jgi:hypothetical protein
VNSVAVGPVPGFLIDENWIEEMLEQDRVCVDGDGVEGVDDCVLLVSDSSSDVMRGIQSPVQEL